MSLDTGRKLNVNKTFRRLLGKIPSNFHSNFADIIKVAITLVKKTFKRLSNSQHNRNLWVKIKFLILFPDITKIANFDGRIV